MRFASNTYPFFSWGKEWTSSLTAALAESLTQTWLKVLIGDDSRKNPKCSSESGQESQCFLPANTFASSFPVPLPDYAAPSWAVPEICRSGALSETCKVYLRPATWLSVLGRDGFYPAAAFLEEKDAPANTSHEQTLHICSLFPKESGDRPAMPLSMKLCLIVILAIAAFHA
jgi:hypothetical protein